MKVTYFPFVSDRDQHLPLYLTSIGYDYTEVHVRRENGYQDFQWLHTISGSGQLLLNGHTYTLSEGLGLFIYPGEPHIYYPTSETWQTEWLTFNGKEAASIVKDLGLRISGTRKTKNLESLSNRIKNGYMLAHANSEYQGLDIANFLFDMLVTIVKVTSPENTPPNPGFYQKLLPVMNYLEEHYSEPVTLNHLAELIEVSPQYLCSLFKSVTGTRPIQYINHLRINKAKAMMLINPDLTIAEISKRVGFESPSYFTAVFKKNENRTPGQFIALHRFG